MLLLCVAARAVVTVVALSLVATAVAKVVHLLACKTFVDDVVVIVVVGVGGSGAGGGMVLVV